METATLDFDYLALRDGLRLVGGESRRLDVSYDVDDEGRAELKEAMCGTLCLYSIAPSSGRVIWLSDKQVAKIEEWLTELESVKAPASRDYDRWVNEW